VVHIDKKKAKVWDSCAPRRKSAHTPRVAQLKRMVSSLHPSNTFVTPHLAVDVKNLLATHNACALGFAFVFQLVALDFMVGEDIAFLFEHSFAFSNFTVVEANAPQQPNGYDCGMFVCMFMDDTIPTTEQLELVSYICRRS